MELVGNELKVYVQDYIEKFEITCVEDLKSLKDWCSIENTNIKNKIYQRAYYIQSKSSESSIPREPVKEIVPVITQKVGDTPQIFSNKQKFSTLSYMYATVVVFSLIFLMNESRMFYVSYGFSTFNSMLLPLLVEGSILLLSIGKEVLSRLLMVLLIIYNVISFSFFTINEYSKEVGLFEQVSVQKGLFMEEKKMLQTEYSSMKVEIDKNRILYETAVKNKYVTRANELYMPRIKSLEGRFNDVSQKISVLNNKVSNSKVSKSLEALFVGTVALIFLKLALQVVSIIFLSKLTDRFLSPSKSIHRL